MDRQEMSRSLAKACAYKECGKDAEAQKWGMVLVAQMQAAGILQADEDDEAETERLRAEMNPNYGLAAANRFARST